MQAWRFYDLTTGIFTASSMSLAHPGDLATNTPADHGAAFVEVDHLSQRVDIEATAAAQAAAIASFVQPPNTPVGFAHTPPVVPPVLVDYRPPAPPGDELQAWTWDTSLKRWRSTPTLRAVQLAQWERLKSVRTSVINAPLVTAIGTFDADPDSHAKMAGAIQLMQFVGAPQSVVWTLADNTTATLTLMQLVTVFLQFTQREQQAFATGTALRAAINAATTPEAVAAIAWPT